MRFRGEHSQKVDDKCRLSIPAGFRQLLEAAKLPRLVVAKSTTNPCLQVFPLSEWEKYEDKVTALPKNNKDAQWLMHFQIASSQQVEPDSHGRIVLAPALRKFAGINASSEVVVMGQVFYFEIWAQQHCAAENQAFEAPDDERLERLAALDV